MFFRKKNQNKMPITYDKENEVPVLKCSICNGEQVAGFQNIHTGKIRDVMLIRNERELEAFQNQYQLDEIKKVY